MNRTRTLSAVLMLVSLTVVFPVAGARAQSGESDKESAAVRQVIDSFMAAFNNHDAHGWAAPFGEDGDFTNVSGLTKHGQKEVEERFQELFAGSLKDAHRTAKIRHLRFVKPDVAAVDAEWELIGSRAKDGSENAPRRGMFTFVLVKQNGRWMFADFHESEFVTMK